MSNTSERRTRRKFTDESKADAVALVGESGGQIAKVAKELGIYDSSLGNWVRQAREQAAGAPRRHDDYVEIRWYDASCEFTGDAFNRRQEVIATRAEARAWLSS